MELKEENEEAEERMEAAVCSRLIAVAVAAEVSTSKEKSPGEEIRYFLARLEAGTHIHDPCYH